MRRRRRADGVEEGATAKVQITIIKNFFPRKKEIAVVHHELVFVLFRGRGGQTHQLTFYTPERPGRVCLTFYLVSDAYLGLDQQFELRLDVEEGFREPTEDVDDDEARLELLRRGREEMERARGGKKKEEDYSSLGARPKTAAVRK